MTWPQTINGHTYTESDFSGFGYVTTLPTLINDVATVGAGATTDAAAAAASATLASTYAAALVGSSSTSTLVGTGSKSLTASTGKQWSAGQYLYITRTSAPTTWMAGQVTSYNSGSGALVVDVQATNGSGTYTDWTIAIGGARGATGSINDLVVTSKSAIYTAVSGDKGTILECTGTWTLSLTAAATLGSGWWVYVRNNGTGTITIHPNSTETIDGATTKEVKAGSTVLLQCDGTGFRFANRMPMRRLIFDSGSVSVTPASGGENLKLTAVDPGLGVAVNRVVYGNSLFLAMPNSAASNVATSPDGITWTLRAMPSSALWSVGTNGTDKFIGIVAGATTTAKSTNGTSWSSATALPGSANSGLPRFLGATCVVPASTASTVYTSSDNGTTWGTQTTPASITTQALHAVGSVFWFWSSGTTAYTSATGATGSWTSRTLPITPASYDSIGITSTGDLSIWDAVGNCYETTDGINWTAQSTITSAPHGRGGIGWAKFGSVPLAYYYSNNASRMFAWTYHNSRWVERCAPSIFASPSYNTFATSGTVAVFCNQSSTTYSISTLDMTSPTALFES